MEYIIGAILGIIFVAIAARLTQIYDQLVKRIHDIERTTHENYHEYLTEILDLREEINELKSSKFDNNKIKILEDELKFEKKSNGLNFQKVFKDLIKLKEHMTWMSQSKD